MKLTNKNSKSHKPGRLLTNSNKAKFKMSLERSLENGFCFKKLGQREIKEFNSFIDKTVGNNLTVPEVNEKYGRKPDSTDVIDGHYVQHYQVSRKSRIHGYMKEGYLVICRIDFNHKIH